MTKLMQWYDPHGERGNVLPSQEVDDDDKEEGEEGEGVDDDESNGDFFVVFVLIAIDHFYIINKSIIKIKRQGFHKDRASSILV